MPTTPLPELVDALLAGPRPLPIVSAGVPVLRRPALPYEGQLSDGQLDRLVVAMRETMHAAPGVGLAAPQIGIPLRIAVIEDPAEVSAEVREARGRVPLTFRVLVNPSYEPVGDPGRRVAFFEGCLSVPGWQAVVARPERIRLRGQDERGRVLDEEFAGWPARIVQHETDHLDGMLYLDRAETRSLASARSVAELWSQPTPADAARALNFPLPGA
ncbi:MULTISPECIES: peptide deformylase [Streptomyces]|uniref:Peptide deformylase n=1 Tax=Streptomyces lonegramiae TaxID=3075524 RepID=A0ABU2XGD0_9ACTN|nr:peptide deformylase [Streptomyces sp. DSM 41529]MDT0545003.1 peptide deformylase [Streptomyces sp. DSM 41529]